jgi:general stress protein 26
MTTMSLKEKIMEIIAGPHPAAVATMDGKRPAVRYMVLSGFSDMTLVGATMKSSNKVGQLEKNPESAITIWSGKELSDPYVEINAMGKVYEDTATKKKYWTPAFDELFKSPENPEFVVLVFTASEITYHAKNMASREVWTSSFTGIDLERNASD